MKLLNSSKLTMENVPEYILWYLRKHWHKVDVNATYQANLYIFEHLLNSIRAQGGIESWRYIPDTNIQIVYNYYYTVDSFDVEMP